MKALHEQRSAAEAVKRTEAKVAQELKDRQLGRGRFKTPRNVPQGHKGVPKSTAAQAHNAAQARLRRATDDLISARNAAFASDANFAAKLRFGVEAAAIHGPRELLSTIQAWRGLLASADMGVMFRQGAPFVHTKQWRDTWKPGLKAMRDADFAADTQRRARNSWNQSPHRADGVSRVGDDAFYSADRAGLDFVEFEDEFISKASQRAEEYQKNWLTDPESLANRGQLNPVRAVGGIVRASERVHVVPQNLLRKGLFDDFAGKINELVSARQMTLAQAREELDFYAKNLNIATGRGNVPKAWLKSDAWTVAATTLFSARFRLSRIQYWLNVPRVAAGLPLDAAKALGITQSSKAFLGVPPNARVQVAKEMASFVATRIAFMSAMATACLAVVEMNPLSSDWGKARFRDMETGILGATRIDMWGSFQQPARVFAALMTQERMSTTSRDVNPVTVTDVIKNYARSGLNPVTSLIVDTLSGETYIGEDFELKDLVTDPETVKDRFVFLAVQDVIDAVRENDITSASGAHCGSSLIQRILWCRRAELQELTGPRSRNRSRTVPRQRS